MSKFLQLLSVFALVLVLSTGPQTLINQSFRAPATDTVTEVIKTKTAAFPNLNETAFYQLVEVETKRVFNKMQPMLAKEEAKGLKKLQQKTIKILKSLNMWDHFKHLLITHGAGVAITSIISEVVTIFVIPPALVGMGFGAAAALVGGVPSPTYMIPAYLAFRSALNKKKLGKELGLNLLQVRALDKLRVKLIGFSIDHRVMSVVLKGLDEDQEVNIIRRKFGRFRSVPHGNIIEMYEVEKIIKDSLGDHRFSIIKEFSHGDDALMANMLMQEINRDPKMKLQFHDLMELRISTNTVPLNFAEHSRFYRIHEKLSLIDRYRSNLRKFKGTMNKELQAQGMVEKSTDNFLLNPLKGMAPVNEYIADQLAQLDLMEHEIKIFEYRYLAAIKDDTLTNSGKFTGEAWDILKRLQGVKRGIDKTLYEPNGAVNYSNGKRLERYLSKLTEQNKEFHFQLTLKKSKANCASVMESFLLHSL